MGIPVLEEIVKPTGARRVGGRSEFDAGTAIIIREMELFLRCPCNVFQAITLMALFWLWRWLRSGCRLIVVVLAAYRQSSGEMQKETKFIQARNII